MTPQLIQQLDKELDILINADDKRYITVKAAAAYLGMKKDDMYGKNGFCKIPKLVFYKWCKGEL